MRAGPGSFLSIVEAGHGLKEPHAVELPDGRLVMISRPEGDICWSRDRGLTWTPLVAFGIRMSPDALRAARRRAALSLYGSSAPETAGCASSSAPTAAGRGLRRQRTTAFSWMATLTVMARARYCPTGALYVIYQQTGSHRIEDAKANSLLSHVRVRADTRESSVCRPCRNASRDDPR